MFFLVRIIVLEKTLSCKLEIIRTGVDWDKKGCWPRLYEAELSLVEVNFTKLLSDKMLSVLKPESRSIPKTTKSFWLRFYVRFRFRFISRQDKTRQDNTLFTFFFLHVFIKDE